MKIYYVLYFFQNKVGSGIGSAELARSREIQSWDDVNQISDDLLKTENSVKGGMTGITIISWTRLPRASRALLEQMQRRKKEKKKKEN